MKDYVARTIATYDAIAPDYRLTATPEVRAWEEESMQIFRGYLPGDRVLVPGCGDGRDSRYLSSLGLEVTSFDLSQRMLNIAKSLDPGGVYQKLDLRNLPSLKCKYDGIYASGCLYHLTRTELTACLKDIHHLLNPGGILYLNLKQGSGEGFRSQPGPGYPGGPEARQRLRGERFYVYYSLREMRALVVDFRMLQERPLQHAEKVREFWLRNPSRTVFPRCAH